MHNHTTATDLGRGYDGPRLEVQVSIDGDLGQVSNGLEVMTKELQEVISFAQMIADRLYGPVPEAPRDHSPKESPQPGGIHEIKTRLTTLHQTIRQLESHLQRLGPLIIS